jgi:hypothetical protein
MTRRQWLASAAAPALAPASTPARIRRIDIFHHSHNDIGYTDIPSLCMELQVRFLDAAIDACLRLPSFRWTAESMAVVDDWWREASPARRNQLISLVRKGQLDVMALPFNQAPFLDARQWDLALRWVPEALWKQLQPRAAVQSDVNGFPRAGAMRLLDRGVSRLVMGINADSGGPPFRRPSAFWWQMPDGRRLFVWNGYHYGVAYSWFEPKDWLPRQAKAASLTYRPAREGDFMRTGEASLRAAHAHLLTKAASLEKEGYDYESLILSYTGQWRYDNDAPWPPLASFVDAWNKLGLEPRLRLTTATEALLDMEKSVGARIRTLEGEWTDWWANGIASGPREVAASRHAKRSIEAALSPMWGPLSESARRKSTAILKDLCLFDEHTWGANESISHPWSLFTQGQYAEKSLTAHRPMAHAEFLLAQRVRYKLEGAAPGLHVANPSKIPFSGWVEFEANALRREVSAERVKGTGKLRIWAANLAPGEIRHYDLAELPGPGASETSPTIFEDSSGWPRSAQWPGMARPMFHGAIGDFCAITLVPPANRSTITRLHANPNPLERAAVRHTALRRIGAAGGKATREDNAHTVVFTQEFEHPRLRRARRTLEIWKGQPRARLTVTIDRISSTAPEVFYLETELGCGPALPRFTNGGVPFTPYTDQLEGSCRDYFAIDGWAEYAFEDGRWLWYTRDAPLVSVGGPQTLERRTDPPPAPQRLAAMVFDNQWHTNFAADSHGEMEFQFDLLWSAQPLDLSGWSDPLVFFHPGLKETPEILDRVYKP